MPFNENKGKQARPDEKQLPKKIEDRTKLLKAALPSKFGITTKQLAEETGLSRPIVNKWMRDAPDSFVNEGSFKQVDTDKENVWVPNPMARYQGERAVQVKPVKMGALDLSPHASGQNLLICAQVSGLQYTDWVDFDLEDERKRIDLRSYSGTPSHTVIFGTNVGGQQSIPIRVRGVNESGRCALQTEAIRLPSNIDHKNLWDRPQQENGGVWGKFKTETVPVKLLKAKETQSSHPPEDTERIEVNGDYDDPPDGSGWVRRSSKLNIWADD